MKAADRQKLLDRYTGLFNEHGYGPKALGWADNRHYLRYAVLLSQWNVEGGDILDFGCGFGDLYDFLKKIKLDVRYHGVDLNPLLIAEGKKAHPRADLEARDVFKEGLPRKYDYIFSSGSHNTKIRDNRGFIHDTFALFDRHAKKGFALNFLSTHVDFRLKHTYHADPAEILKLSYRYSSRVVLRNDYMPFEFSIFVDKQTAFDKKTRVYAPYKTLVPKRTF